ncbi:hypothetical protein [Trinickia acidisoli]|uniref:hypothetical protein n=1 Tax=Trinickia acidisoli TaxID=2767482 RepID=UPI001A8D242F|nr:hypothetical protein [Trinickia acidisoli]
MATLLKVAYLGYFVNEATGDHAIDLFREAEAILNACGLRGHQENRWTLDTYEADFVARIVALHDEQMRSLPSYRFDAAWQRLHAFLASKALSPLPALP